MSEPAVIFQNVTKTFGKTKACSDVNFAIGAGEFFSLLGPSGCGKTTLLRMIAGFEFPDEGKVLVGGKDMSAVPAHKRPVNMVFQSYALFPHMTIFENVAFGLRVQRQSPQLEINKRVDEALELVRLPQVKDRYPAQLSGGQQQRVAFARAIVNRPSVLLLDEPLSALDPRIREDMQEELARFKKELAITFVMVTHDQAEAFALSDRIAVLNQGCLEQLGTAQEIYNAPATPFVADFIGQTNLLACTILEWHWPYARTRLNHNGDGDHCLWAHAGGEITEAEAQKKMPAGAGATIWIRTDAFANVPAGTPSGGQDRCNYIDGTIVHGSFLGSQSQYRVKWTDAITLTASFRNEAHTTGGAGQSVRLSLPAEAVHVIANPPGV